MNTFVLICSGYSQGAQADILTVTVDETGKCRILDTCRQGENPSFCVRRGDFLYLASEQPGRAYICAYRIVGGRLQEVGEQLEVPGSELCHLYAGERALYGSCYGTGDFFAVDYALTTLLWHRKPVYVQREIPKEVGVQKRAGRQLTAHAHWMTQWGEQLLATDLGNDRIWRFRLEAGLPVEELEPLALPAGAGPRQILPLKDGRHLVSVEELDSTLCLWREREGRPECIQTLSATAYPGENYPATACLAEDGTILVCNRGADTLAAFSCSKERLEPLGEWATQHWPRYLMGIPGTTLFANACDRAGKCVIFSWSGKSLERRDEFELPGASCAVYMEGMEGL